MDSTTPSGKSHSSLHNFTLPHHLKWKKDTAGVDQHHQRRRSTKSPSNASASSPVLQPSPRDSSYCSPPAPLPIRQCLKRSTIAADPPPPPPPPPPPHLRRHDLASESADQHRIHSKLDGARRNTGGAYPEKIPQKFDSKWKGKEVESKSKLLIKIPFSSRTAEAAAAEENPIPPPPPKAENKADADEETKMWNLRPRRPIRRPRGADGGGPFTINGSDNNNKAQPKSGEKKKEKEKEKEKEKKKEKKRVSIFVSLSKEEIEEDIFSMVGTKPARRPKKRPKSVQKLVDNCFPGLWLVSVSTDSYKVSEKSTTTTTPV